MMPHALQTDPQPMLKAWALQHCRNEIQRAILFHAPDHFTWEDCNAVEALMMAEFERWIAHPDGPDLDAVIRESLDELKAVATGSGVTASG